MKEELYRRSSLEKLVSPDSLDEYIKIERPHTWLTLTAVFVLIAALAVWMGASRLKTTVGVSGIAYEGKVYAWIAPENAQKLKEGMKAEIKNRKIGEIEKVSEEPVSREDAGGSFVSDYFRAAQLSDWNTALVIETDGEFSDGETLKLQIVTQELNPLEFLTD